MVQAAGYAPSVMEYLQAGWTRRPAARAGRPGGPDSVRDLLREKGAPAEELGLLSDNVSDETLLAAMVEHPILVNRPIVVTPRGVALARPSEKVFDLLDQIPESFTKEDGEIVRH
jgi:arsenate reductase